jgi:long-chain acyl-CoA synthetase
LVSHLKLTLVGLKSQFSPVQSNLYSQKIRVQLQLLNLPSGALVGLRLPPALEALFTKACIEENLATCALGPAIASGFSTPDLVVSASPEDSGFGNRFLLVNPELMSDIEHSKVDQLAEINPEPHDLVRLVFSSGTTGSPKAIAFTKQMLETRYRSGYEHWMSKTPFMSLLGIGSVSGFQTFYANMSMGETYFVPGAAEENFDMIKKHEIKSIKASPSQISALIDVAIERRQTLPSLELIQSAGSFLPNHLARLTEKILGGKVRNLYGSTEVGTVATRDHIPEDPFFAGTVVDDVKLEIVDENQKIVPLGEVGIVRYRKEGMATEYYRNPEATKLTFRDGWFYPGDQGRLDSNRGLYLAGRVSESFNSGGVKIDPIRIDNFAVESAGVVDAAAFAFEDDRAVQRIALAVVSKDGFDVIAFVSKLKTAFGEAHPVVVFEVDEIPRNETGKVVRSKLTELYNSVRRS